MAEQIETLAHSGKIIGDFTVAKPADNQFFLIGAGVAEHYHMRWFEQHLPSDGSVVIHRYDMGLVGLSIAGPKSRDVLQALTLEPAKRTPNDLRLMATQFKPKHPEYAKSLSQLKGAVEAREKARARCGPSSSGPPPGTPPASRLPCCTSG